MKLKITITGNSAGVILPRELPARLRLEKGGELFALETPDRIRLTTYAPTLAWQVEVAEEVMRKRRTLLHKLARSVAAMIIEIERPLAIAIHERQLAEHGGGIGVRDDSRLDSALAHPQQAHAYGDPPPDLADLADLAASLASGSARNHPFVDGNKRTAAVACETFILLNGGTLDADDLELYPCYVALAEG